MVSFKTNSLIVGAVGLGLVGVSSIPALGRIYTRSFRRKGHGYDEIHGIYEDADGAATEESQNAYSVAVQRYLILASALTGFVLAVAAAVLGTVHPGSIFFFENWFAFGSWGFLVIQALNLFWEHSCVKRYDSGIKGSISCVVLVLALCFENGHLSPRGSPARADKSHVALTVAQLAFAVILLVAFMSLPRRPTLFVNGQPVDGQYSVSAISRYTFVWGGDVLAFARANKGLDLPDLPVLDQHERANDLQQRFNRIKKRSRLWKSVYMSHASVFMMVYVLVVISSATQFAPQYAMYNLLKLLEQRAQGTSVALIAWAWVFGLGFAMVVSSWVESWLFWIVWSRIGITMRVELSALIFMKAMRRKDVKGVGKSKTQAEDKVNGNIPPIVNKTTGHKGKATAPGADKKAQEDDDDDDAIQRSRQSTINLVGVDTKRVTDFAAFSYIFPSVLCKVAVSMTFLGSIIGWRSLLAGLAVSVAVTPLNILCSKKYSQAQEDLMKARDQKMAVVTEALQGIRQIKFSALEQQWQAKIEEKRSLELATQRKVFMFDTVLISIWILGPVMLSAVSLAVYAALHGELSPSVAFTTIAVFGAIEMTLAVLPELTTVALDAWVSINRVEKYLNGPDKEEITVSSDRVEFEEASVAWPAEVDEENADRFVLRNINLCFPNKELSIVSGRTGSGKSLLLASILGEIDILAGIIRVPRAASVDERLDHKATRGNWIIENSMAFVAQIPWIENATIRDNILFGLPFDAGRYKQTLSACALEKDLDMLPDGELTDIGANGINLSGGQRWRVSFARALYSRAGILVLDDIFSAVDAHVGRHLFEEALTGNLGEGRTRILVTHHVELCLPKTMYIVVLGNGTVEHAGSIEDLRRRGSLAEIFKNERYEQDKEKDDASKAAGAEGNALRKETSRRSEKSAKIDDGELDGKGKLKPKKFIEDEKREAGKVKLGVYNEYLKNSGGMWFWVPLLMLFAGYMGLILVRSYWISLWTRSYSTESALPMFFQQTSFQHHTMSDNDKAPKTDLWFYLLIYIGLSVIICVVGTLRYLFTFLGSLKASRILFDKLTYTVLRAPLRWLDTVPVGRVLNRFTADFNIIDSRIANDVGFMLYQFMQVIGITVAGLFVSLYMLLFATVLLAICVFVATRYLIGARDVKRLESNAKSPIFEQFGSALAGVGTIRAYDKADAYVQRMFDRIDDHARTFWHLWLFNRWMGFRLNLVGAIFAILVSVIIVSTKSIDASLAGFALGFALQYTDAIVFAIRTYSATELDMNATERIIEYSSITTEDQSGDDAPAAWPTEGRLEVDNIVVGYDPDLPPVLKGLSFSVAKNQRIGVVGRTGAGKSSLTLALFRFLEARSGSIHIDGLDISKIKLHDLRSRLAIIPQDPVLFSGTVRSNLDAFDEHTDAELRDALERVHLVRSTGLTSRDEIATVGTANGTADPAAATATATAATAATAAAADTNTNIFTSLASRISEGGLNLSQGQRQLLCLARAIVSRPKIMVLDEATSAVDMATDVLIQRSIRDEFTDATLIVIAHRLSTVVDFDRILVMSEGVAVEFGPPRELMRSRGVFWGMVRSSGEAGRLEEMIGGEGWEGNGEGRA